MGFASGLRRRCLVSGYPVRTVPSMNRVLAVYAILIAVIGSGCSGGDDSQPELASDTGCENGGHYYFFEGPDWEFREAVDYPQDLGPVAAVEPSLDWYSEHERFVPTSDPDTVEGQSLRMSGHGAALEEHAEELFTDVSETQVDGRRALVGTGSEGAPSVVTVAVDDSYTLMFLSYGLAPEELIELAGQVEPVCQEEWTEAGGQVLDCMPTEPGCIAIP